MNRFLTILLSLPLYCLAQDQPKWWHGIERTAHYRPEGSDFININGKLRFNRALYGGNTAFRVEAGDLPEFALYLPGMGGNFRMGLISDKKSRWLIDAAKIETRYRPGSMLYQIEDEILHGGKLNIDVLPCFDKEAMIVRITTGKIPASIQLVTAYGGATGLKFSRDGDIGADPESSFYLQPGYCKDNLYRIDKNRFDLLFGSKKPLTEEERYEIQHISGNKSDQSVRTDLKAISGIFPQSCMLKLADANSLQTPVDFIQSHGKDQPALAAIMELRSDTTYYFFIQSIKVKEDFTNINLANEWSKAESTRKQIASRVLIQTPDAYINTLGSVLSTAADAIWEEPSYLHGAVAWRMRLNGWRGAYVADVLGWHDRARKHFSSYALSQLTTPESAPIIMDTALHLARGLEKLGTSMYSSGYISRNPNGDFRAHHYDMNMVFVDQIFNHFQWTGDTAYLRQLWPLLKRHMDWEKRNFDTDGDGLYDSYAAIWASDALQYSGGGVTHSSAYNYRANIMMAELAGKLKEDPTEYKKEAEKILTAVNKNLWISDKGWYAEYKDLLGNKLVHPSAGLWTVYHAIDSKLPDPFQAYQLLQYVRNNIPHIPVRANGIEDTNLYTLSTSNWQPYTWSLNNVALAELMHTSLAFWQGGDSEEGFKLWRSSLIESMFLGASPGNIQQLSFYDAVRGELYRDFADPIGMTARSLVEGLFGIRPDAWKDTIYVIPGFPLAWDHASIQTPEIKLSWKKEGNKDRYIINADFSRQMNLCLKIKARAIKNNEITVNGRKVIGYFDISSIGFPVLVIKLPRSKEYSILVEWGNEQPEVINVRTSYTSDDSVVVNLKKASIQGLSLYNAGLLKKLTFQPKQFNSPFGRKTGDNILFLKLKQGEASWWAPVSLTAQHDIKFDYNGGSLDLINRSKKAWMGELWVNHKLFKDVELSPEGQLSLEIPKQILISGSNLIVAKNKDRRFVYEFVKWDLANQTNYSYDKISIAECFNDEVNKIYQNKYLSPRPNATVLQLPVQGIGNWAYPLTTAVINDSALREKAGEANEIKLSNGIPFFTPGTKGTKNIVFTSQWDNFPDSILIPLTGKSSHAYFLMAGSTNPMQSRMINGEILVEYQDGTFESLKLRNPENWWPIEQDFYIDGFAFTTDAERPLRLYFKNASEKLGAKEYISIKGFSNFGVANGAATILDLPLNPDKQLKHLKLKAVANDVVIGLMSITLLRSQQ